MMKYLADTHILLWAMENNIDNTKMPTKAKEIMLDENSMIFYSFVNVWEVALRRVNHPEKIPYTAEEFDRLCRKSEFSLLDTKVIHALEMDNLHYDIDNAKVEHKDPFDRLLLAQAKYENMKFLTHDHLIPFYSEECIVKV